MSPQEQQGHYNSWVIEDDSVQGKVVVKSRIPGATYMDPNPLPERVVLELLQGTEVAVPVLVSPKPGDGSNTLRYRYIEGEVVGDRSSLTERCPDSVVKFLIETWKQLQKIDVASALPALAKGWPRGGNDVNVFYGALWSFAEGLRKSQHSKIESLLKLAGLPEHYLNPLSLVELKKRGITFEPKDLILCHGDIHRKNLVRATDGSLKSVDWELAMIAPLEWDIAITWLRLPLAEDQLKQVIAELGADRELVEIFFTEELAKSVAVDGDRYPELLRQAVDGQEKGALMAHLGPDLHRKVAAACESNGVPILDPYRLKDWMLATPALEQSTDRNSLGGPG